MKKAKRVLALLLTLTMCLTVLPVGAFATGETPALVVAASNVSGEPGQTVEVPIEITENPGVVAFGIQIAYDSTKLTLKEKPVVTELLNVGNTNVNSTSSKELTDMPYTMVFDNSTAPANITATGTLITVSFIIKDGVSVGEELPIQISFADNSYPINYELADVPFSSENGVIVVAEHSWSTATYIWNEDNTVCTAERSCACGETETENGTITTETISGTCTEPGFTIYTATFTSPAFEAQVEALAGDAALGHDWGQWEIVKQPTVDENGEARRICKRDESHVENWIVSVYGCFHTCLVCGYCTDSTCPNMPKCDCGVESVPLETKPLEEEQIRVDSTPMDIPQGQTIQAVAVEVMLPSTADIPLAQPSVHPYEEHILNAVEGYAVETVYEISLQVKETGEEYILPEGKTAAVTLFVGAENAQAIDAGKMFLIRVAAKETMIYGQGHLTVTAEKNGADYTGYISFVTDGFSTFVLVSKPTVLVIDMEATSDIDGCIVVLSANKAFRCDLYLAAYDVNGRMLGIRAICGSNLAAKPEYNMRFEGTASKVKAFMTESETFNPKYIAIEDDLR